MSYSLTACNSQQEGKAQGDAYRIEVPYINGKREGTFKEYAPGNKLYAQGRYLHDQLHGMYRSYTPEGEVASERLYENGKVRFWKIYWQEEANTHKFHFISKPGYVIMRDGITLDLDDSAPDYLEQEFTVGDSIITYRFMHGNKKRVSARHI